VQENSQDSVFISGGTSGLGLKTAEHFVRKGGSVVFCGRNEIAIDTTTRFLKSLASKEQLVLGIKNDVTNPSTTKNMVEKVNQLEVNIATLICNAGMIGPINRFLENQLDDWQYAFNVNLYGTLNLVMEFLPSMILRKKGRVIHISGGGATSPLFGMTSYAASKAAAVRLIETLALEYADSGVTFNSVAPGILKTKLLDQMLEAGPDLIGETLFTKSKAKAEAESDSTRKAIELIDFLASESSAGITGKLISAEWDNWSQWAKRLSQIKNSDIYTLRRITGRDRGYEWGDL
jgi:NAD(P)-dependent dehydrogenase (short-subunit alcohol dehydrogenase family)